MNIKKNKSPAKADTFNPLDKSACHIIFPEEDEIENDTHRIFLGIRHLELYYQGIGLEIDQVLLTMLNYSINRYCDGMEDLELARQQTIELLSQSLDRSIKLRKEYPHQADLSEELRDFHLMLKNKPGVKIQ